VSKLMLEDWMVGCIEDPPRHPLGTPSDNAFYRDGGVGQRRLPGWDDPAIVNGREVSEVRGAAGGSRANPPQREGAGRGVRRGA
jgi:hypothetical protein